MNKAADTPPGAAKPRSRVNLYAFTGIAALMLVLLIYAWHSDRFAESWERLSPDRDTPLSSNDCPRDLIFDQPYLLVMRLRDGGPDLAMWVANAESMQAM